MDLAAKRKCQECGGHIPRWTGVGKARRQVRKDAKFCSPRCAQKASGASGARTPFVTAIEPQKPLQHSASTEAPAEASPSAGSAWRVVAGPVPFCDRCGLAIQPDRQGLLLPRRAVDGGLRCAACSGVIPACRKRAVPVLAEVAAA
jgi:hypothetical protein